MMRTKGVLSALLAVFCSSLPALAQNGTCANSKVTMSDTRCEGTDTVIWNDGHYLELAKQTELITITATNIGVRKNNLPMTILPRSQWIQTNFFGGFALETISRDNPGFPIREERPVPLRIRCLADSNEGAQNLAGGQKLLPGQTLRVNESIQYSCE